MSKPNGGEDFITRYVARLHKYRYFIIIGWFLFMSSGLYTITHFINNTSLLLQAPPSSPAQQALNALDENFHGYSNQIPTLALIEPRVRGESVITAEVQEFSVLLEQSFWNYRENPDAVPIQFESYYALRAANNTLVANNFKSPDNASTFAILTVQGAQATSGIRSHKPTDFVVYMRKELDRIVPHDASFTVTFTGLLVFGLDINEGTEKDMTRTDSISLPMALVLLAYTVKSITVVPLPLFVMGASAALSFGIMFLVSLSTFPIVSFCPSLMLSGTVAMSVDYSLFILSRFGEELRNGAYIAPAVETTLRSAGHTVVASGSTLAVCFFALCMFPLSLLQSAGLGAGIAISMTVVTSLTLLPTILLTVGPTLARYMSFERSWSERLQCAREAATCNCKPACCPPRQPRHENGVFAPVRSTRSRRTSNTSQTMPIDDDNDNQLDMSLLLEDDDGVDSNHQLHMSLTMDGSVQDGHGDKHNTLRKGLLDNHGYYAGGRDEDSGFEDDPPMSPRRRGQSGPKGEGRCSFCSWFKVAMWATSWPWNLVIIVLCVAISIPFAMHALNFKKSSAFNQLVPRGDSSTDAYDKMVDTYGAGTLFPTNLLIVNKRNVPFLENAQYWNQAQDLIVQLAGNASVPLDHVVAPVTVQGQLVSSLEMSLALLLKDVMDPKLVALRFIYDEFINVKRNGVAMLVEMQTTVDPFSGDGHAWLHQTRDALDRMRPHYPDFELYIAKGDTVNVDAIHTVFGLFPYMVLATSFLVFIIIGAVFRSLLVPLRAILTIILTLCFVYGAAVMIYQHGMLDWLDISGLTSYGALNWFTPIMSFSVLVGLSLDYDVFLLTRVFEYRKAGYSERASIVHGVEKTGGIITAAGLIMSLAFGGLLGSSLEILNQLSCFLVVSVLFDTFIVRTLMVPAIMSMLGTANWWPLRMPEVKHHALEAVGGNAMEE